MLKRVAFEIHGSLFRVHAPYKKPGLPRWLSGKNLPAIQKMQEMLRVQSLGWEDPNLDVLEKGTPTHCSFLALENPMERGAWQATVHRVTKS